MKICFLILFAFSLFSSSHAFADIASFKAIGPFGGIVTSVIEDTDGAIFIGTEGGGVYKSADGGGIWVSASSGLANPFVYALTVTKDSSIFAGTKAGVFRSSDKGKNWIKEHGIVSEKLIPFLAVDKDGAVYASVWASGVARKIKDTWELLNNELQNTFVNEIAFTKEGTIIAATEGGVYKLDKGESRWKFVGLIEYLVQSILVDNNNHLYAATWSSNILRSIDGKEWEQLGKGINPFVKHLVMSSGGEIFAATEDGVFKLLPALKEWKSLGLKGISIKNMQHLNNNKLCAASYGKGLYILSDDSGAAWLQKNNGITNMQILSAFIDSENTLYAGTTWGLFIKSKDKPWEEVDIFSGKRVQAVAKDSKGNIYTGTTSGILKYDVNEKKWRRLKKDYPPAFSNISIIAVDKNDSIYAGVEGEGLFRSDDKGESWKELENGLTNKRILAIIFDSKEDRIYLGTSNGIFRGIDKDGGQFENITGDLKNTIIQSIAIDKDDNIYAGTDGGGVFVKNEDKIWKEKNSGLKNKRVLSLFSDNKNNVYTGTHDGLFVVGQGSSEWEDISNNIVNRIVQTINIDNDGKLLIGTWGGGILKKE